MGRSVTFTSPDIPAHVVELLGPAPLLKGENLKQYQALLSEIARTVKPAEIMEWLWVKDIVDLTWDIRRYRRLKANGIQNTGLEATCLSYTSTASALAALHLIEQMQASAELRRNSALNEIESRRWNLGQALRQASDHVIEAEATPALVPAG
jgi:hypothetical protein